jgi:hypothetical protein
VSDKPAYKYRMFLSSNHKTSIEIGAIADRLNKGEVNQPSSAQPMHASHVVRSPRSKQDE